MKNMPQNMLYERLHLSPSLNTGPGIQLKDAIGIESSLNNELNGRVGHFMFLAFRA